jgi:hypothetical protein
MGEIFKYLIHNSGNNAHLPNSPLKSKVEKRALRLRGVIESLKVIIIKQDVAKWLN